IDGRTDIYSLGAMLYEMLTGEPPHTGATAQAIIARVLTEKPRPMSLARPSVPEHIERAVERALEKVPADRWATADEFCDALKGSASTRSMSGVSRTRRAQAILAPLPLSLLATTVGALLLAAVEWRGAHQSDPADTVRFQIAVNVREVFATSPAPAISPDGRTIAYTGLTAAGNSMVFVRRLDELTPRT